MDKYILFLEVERPTGFLDLSKYARVRPEGGRAEEEFRLQLYHPTLNGLFLFLERSRQLVPDKPLPEILGEELEKQRKAYGTPAEFGKAKPGIISAVYQNYGLLTGDELGEFEDSFENRYWGGLARAVSRSLPRITADSAGQITQRAENMLMGETGRRIGENIKRILDLYHRAFSILEQPVNKPSGDDFFPISANLEAFTTQRAGERDIVRQVEQQLRDSM